MIRKENETKNQKTKQKATIVCSTIKGLSLGIFPNSSSMYVHVLKRSQKCFVFFNVVYHRFNTLPHTTTPLKKYFNITKHHYRKLHLIKKNKMIENLYVKKNLKKYINFKADVTMQWTNFQIPFGQIAENHSSKIIR